MGMKKVIINNPKTQIFCYIFTVFLALFLKLYRNNFF
jgi:hypothetical protein